MLKRRWLLAVGAVAFAAIATGADSCGSSGDSGSKNSGADKQNSSADKSTSDCGIKATDDCTPHVATGDRVRVDALVWQVKSATATKTIGDQQYGLGEKADGMFVVVKVKVHSTKTESATITDDTIQLEAPGGRKYKADSDGTVAAVGAGEKPLFLEDIGPDSTLSSEVVFDVPPKVLNKKLEVRFGELGFGPTHGYVELPEIGSQ